MNRALLPLLSFGAAVSTAHAGTYVLRPERAFDGAEVHAGWIVIVDGDRIQAAGPDRSVDLPPGAQTVDLPGATLLPGLIEGHSHLFLHPYDETPWNDQVLRESKAYRTARAVLHARDALYAGFTTSRDPGTEGAGLDGFAVGWSQGSGSGVARLT